MKGRLAGWSTCSHDEGWEGTVIDGGNDEDGHLGLLVEIRTKTKTFRRTVDIPDVYVIGIGLNWARMEFSKVGLTESEVHYVLALVHSFMSRSAGELLNVERLCKGAARNDALVARVEYAYKSNPRNRMHGAEPSKN